MKKIILFFLCSFVLTLSFAQDANIYFDTDKNNIRINEKHKLDNLLQRYLSDNYQFLLVGHCDQAGSDAYNLALSQRRVEEIKAYFLKNNIPLSSIRIDYQGESQALAVAQEYRKVEIFLIGQNPVPTPPVEKEVHVPILKEEPNLEKEYEQYGVVGNVPPMPPKKEKKWKDFQEFKSSISPEKQDFEMNSEEDIYITGKSGTDIFIPKNAFVDTDGNPVSGNVNIELKEFYSFKDFFSEKLGTKSNGALLETNGMVYLEATQGNKKLQLNGGTDVEILFPQSERNDFSTFYGEREEDGGMNWVQDGESAMGNAIGEVENWVAFSPEGLDLTTEAMARSKNRNANIGGMKGVFSELTPEMRDSLNREWEIERQEMIAEQESRNEMFKRSKEVRTLISSKKLGFINCDRFYREKNTRRMNHLLTIKDEKIKPMAAYLIFTEINSCLSFRYEGTQGFTMNNRLPMGADVILLVTGFDPETDDVYVHQKKLKLKEGIKGEIPMRKSSYDELEQILGGI